MKKSNFYIAAVMLVALCGCEMFSDEKKDDGKKKAEKQELTFLQKGVPVDKNAKNKEADEIGYKKEQLPKLPENTLKALEKVPGPQKNADQKGKKEAPYYEDFILMDGDQSLAVSLVFNSAPVLDVIPAFADVLGFNFISDAELKNTVTLNINSNMTKRELWNTFDRMLTLAGAAVRVDGSMLRILPVSKLARQPDLSVNEQISNEVCYFTLLCLSCQKVEGKSDVRGKLM